MLSASLLASTLAITAPVPAFAYLEFCNRATDRSTLSLALANYNSGIKYVRFLKNGSPGLTIRLNPRWTIRGWWEIAPNECITPISRDLDLNYYYYHVRSSDDSYDDSGIYPLCGRKQGQFHVEYQLDNDNELMKMLALKPFGVESVAIDAAMTLKEACADLGLGYELLLFDQLDIKGEDNYTHEIS